MLSISTVMLNIPSFASEAIPYRQNNTNLLSAKTDSASLSCICRVLDRICLPIHNQTLLDWHREELCRSLGFYQRAEWSDLLPPASSLCCCCCWRTRYERANGWCKCRRSTNDNSGRFLGAAETYRIQSDWMFRETNTEWSQSIGFTWLNVATKLFISSRQFHKNDWSSSFMLSPLYWINSFNAFSMSYGINRLWIQFYGHPFGWLDRQNEKRIHIRRLFLADMQDIRYLLVSNSHSLSKATWSHCCFLSIQSNSLRITPAILLHCANSSSKPLERSRRLITFRSPAFSMTGL